MIDTPFFTLNDVRAIRAGVSVNLDDDFTQYAAEAQRNYVEKLIGAKLYAALLSDLSGGVPQTQRFVDLLDGKVYTKDGDSYLYRGLKMYASYIWLHLHMSIGGTNHTPIGSMLFKDEEAERKRTDSVNQNSAAYYISAADGLEESILRFIDDFKDDYPEFDAHDSIEPAERDNFTSFKVIGETYTDPYNYLY